jgi:hypothetical protein
MEQNLLFLFRLLQHFLHSRSKFDIHSPFVYKIYSEILIDKTDYPEYLTLINIKYDGNTRLFKKDYRLLFRLSRYFKPKTILNLGTTEEACASALAAGFPGSRMITIHHSPDLIAGSGVFDMVLVSGYFPGNTILDYFYLITQHIHNDSVLVICNIHGSRRMLEAWDKIRNHSSVTLTIDLFNLGLVFFREELTKEDFILRY